MEKDKVELCGNGREKAPYVGFEGPSKDDKCPNDTQKIIHLLYIGEEGFKE